MLIAFRDAVQSATLQASGFNNAGAPIENTQDRRLAVTAIAGSLGAKFIECYFDDSYDIRIIAILNHNIPSGENVEVALLDYDLNLIYGETFVSLWTPPATSLFSRNSYFILPSVVTDVFGMTISITGLVTTEFISIGRLWASNVFEPQAKTKMSDFSVATADDTTVNKSDGQQVYVDYRSRYRRLTCTIPFLTEDEAIGTADGTTTNLQDIGFEVGRGGEVIVIPSLSSEQVIHKFGVYGHFQEAPGIQLMNRNDEMGRLYTSTFEVIEDL